MCEMQGPCDWNTSPQRTNALWVHSYEVRKLGRYAEEGQKGSSQEDAL